MKVLALSLLITGGLFTVFTLYVVLTSTTTLPGLNDAEGEPLHFHLEPSALLLGIAVCCGGGYLLTRGK